MKNKDLESRARLMVSTINELICEIETLEGGSVVICQPGYHEENGVCVPDVVVPPATEVTTSAINAITATSALGGGTGKGTQRGVCWSTTTSEPTTDHSHTTDGPGEGAFKSHLIALKPKTLYYVRAYAINNGKTTYGNWVKFTTSDVGTVLPDPDPVPVTNMQSLLPDGHYLKTSDGKPFFILADTGWLMLYELTIEEIASYLNIRKAQGFNAIQVMLLSSRNELTNIGIPSNRAGNFPFKNRVSDNGHNGDPSLPFEPFWAFVDQVVALAQSKGIYLFLLPVWGHAVSPLWVNESNRIFTDPEKAGQYAYWLGNRYKAYKNVCWMLGGDRPAVYKAGDLPWNPGVPDYDARNIWNAMGAGLKNARTDYLITYHSVGGAKRSSTWFHQSSWLSLNTFQSGHGKDRDQFILADRALLPQKPTWDSEPCYENIISEEGLLTTHDVRKAAYRSCFEGACGFTYGELNIFQFYSGSNPWFGANRSWKDTINSEGAKQMGYLKMLMELYPRPEPESSRIYHDNWADDGYHSIGTGNFRKVACRGENYILAYIPEIQTSHPDPDYTNCMGPSIVLNMYGFGNFNESWFNPRTGETSKPIERTNKGYHIFKPAEKGAGIDWVLIINKSK